MTTKRPPKAKKLAAPLDPVVQRLLLDDRQCHVFMRSMIDFGYPSLTFEEVRWIADQVHAGTHSETNVIAVIMCQQIDEAMASKRSR